MPSIDAQASSRATPAAGPIRAISRRHRRRRRAAASVHQHALRLSSRRVAVPERRAPPRLGICRLPSRSRRLSSASASPSSAFPWWACGSSRCWRRPRPLLSPGSWRRSLAAARLAQVTAALAVAFSPLPLFEGTEFQYTSFDFLWWVLIAYFIVRLLKSDDPRWWLAIGAADRPGTADQVRDRLLHCGDSCRARLHARAPVLREPLVLGRRCAGAVDFSAQSRLARAPRLHLLPLPAAHSRARRGRGPRRRILEGPVPDLRQPGRRAAMDCGAHRLPARAPLPHAGADVPGSAGDVRHRQGPRLLHGRRVSHAARHGRGDGRALARFPAPLGPADHRDGLLRGLRVGLGSTYAPSFCRSHRADRSSSLRSRTTATCARKSAGTSWCAPSPESAIRCPPSSKRISASPPATTASTEPSKSSAAPTDFPSPSAPPTPNGCAAIPRTPPTTLIVLGLSAEQANAIFTGCRLAGHNGNSEGVRNEESAVPPRHLCLRPAAHTVGGAVEGTSVDFG